MSKNQNKGNKPSKPSNSNNKSDKSKSRPNTNSGKIRDKGGPRTRDKK